VATRAYENQCVVAYANHCGSEADIVYGGLSSIIGADGSVLAQAGRDEGLLVADLDRARLDASRARLPYIADRRPALF
jgi:5-aminopentanamidase